MPADGNAGCSTEWDYDTLIGWDQVFMGEIKTAQDSPNYEVLSAKETEGLKS